MRRYDTTNQNRGIQLSNIFTVSDALCSMMASIATANVVTAEQLVVLCWIHLAASLIIFRQVVQIVLVLVFAFFIIGLIVLTKKVDLEDDQKNHLDVQILTCSFSKQGQALTMIRASQITFSGEALSSVSCVTNLLTPQRRCSRSVAAMATSFTRLA